MITGASSSRPEVVVIEDDMLVQTSHTSDEDTTPAVTPRHSGKHCIVFALQIGTFGFHTPCIDYIGIFLSCYRSLCFLSLSLSSHEPRL